MLVTTCVGQALESAAEFVLDKLAERMAGKPPRPKQPPPPKAP